MGIFDVFSGKKQRLADIWAAQQAAATRDANQATIAQGRTDALGAVDSGQTSAISALNDGYDAARGRYDQAKTGFQPYVDTGLKALGAYSDAAGLNGSSGYDNAVSSFRASPGYQYRVDQATGAAARKASSIGMLGSGNTLSAITTLAGNEADQDWNSYENRLKGISDQGYAATGAISSLTKGQGDLSAQQGLAGANLYDADAARRANIIQGATGQNVANQTQAGNTITGLSRDSMMAGQQASQNAFGALMGGVNLLAGGLGSAFGSTAGGGTGGLLGSAVKGLGNVFGDASNSWMPRY